MPNSISCPVCNSKAIEIQNNPQRILYRCGRCRKVTEINHEQPYIPMPPLKFHCYNHQGKADALVSALEAKYEQHHGPIVGGAVKFVFSDSDIGGRMSQLERFRKNGARHFFIYPHCARPSLVNAHYPTWGATTAQFVVNEYHAEVLRTYGYTKPIETMGWHLSPVEKFKPRDVRDRPVKVLFAPVHPRNAPIDRQMNRLAFDRLYKHVGTGEIELTVRFIGEIQDSGLQIAQGVTYVNGKMNQATYDMDKADVVIGHQTFAWLAAARGIPCVMFAEDMPTHFGQNNIYNDVACWKSVYHLFRYPLDLLCENDIMGLLRRAAISDREISDWRRRMIGKEFDPAAFVEKVEKYL